MLWIALILHVQGHTRDYAPLVEMAGRVFSVEL